MPDRSGQATGSIEHGARAVAAELDQERPVSVAEAGGPLGVDGDRARFLRRAARRLGQACAR